MQLDYISSFVWADGTLNSAVKLPSRSDHLLEAPLASYTVRYFTEALFFYFFGVIISRNMAVILPPAAMIHLTLPPFAKHAGTSLLHCLETENALFGGTVTPPPPQPLKHTLTWPCFRVKLQRGVNCRKLFGWCVTDLRTATLGLFVG